MTTHFQLPFLLAVCFVGFGILFGFKDIKSKIPRNVGDIYHTTKHNIPAVLHIITPAVCRKGCMLQRSRRG
jgi:hypothetical protein